MVVVYYPGTLTKRELATRVAGLAYCSPNTILNPTLGTPPIYEDFFCVPSSSRLRVSVSAGEKVASLVYLA
jgi:hypothetical protein